MAVYKIFPIQDASIYSSIPTLNTGLDAILDVSKEYSYVDPSNSAANRALIKFSTEDINNTFNSYIGSGSYSASLKMYLATAANIPSDYSLEVYPVYQPWDMGTGRFGEVPIPTDGVSWVNYSTGNQWAISSFIPGTTGSYTSGSAGGGSWYTGSHSTQSFGAYSEKDINIDVTSAIIKYRSGSYFNNGFIVKNTPDKEFDPNYKYTLQFFSRDTNTIYPPALELKWDDSVFPITSNISTNGNINVSLQNAPHSLNDGNVRKMYLSVRDKFPTRTFSTTSLYTAQKYLPSSSYWSLVDYKTKDVIIDFDTQFTKLSADSIGNYFNLYTSGLEPARYYKVVIKSVIGGETLIFDNDYIFKVE